MQFINYFCIVSEFILFIIIIFRQSNWFWHSFDALHYSLHLTVIVDYEYSDLDDDSSDENANHDD